MSLTGSLQEIMEGLDGARGIALVGMDGIVVEEQKRDSRLDLQTLGAEWCGILRQAEKGILSGEAGRMEEVSVAAEKTVIVARRIHEGYFLLLAIEKDGNFGKGRYLLRKAETALRGEL
jgi:predicted regulator of Ras-like GTPase activity (Roadblock/LC7/MglB family)